MKKTIGYIVLESILITFGIFIGFGLDRYRTRIDEEEQKQRLYVDLANDLRKSKDALESMRGWAYVPLKKDLDYMINSIEQDEIQIDTFFMAVARIEYFPDVVEERSTYNSIINSGRIVLFEQDSTFRKIQELYSTFNFMETIYSSVQKNNSRESLTPFVNKYGDRNANYLDSAGIRHIRRKPRVDLVRFKSSEFLNILIQLRNSLWDETFYKSTIDRTNKLILEIEKI